MKHLCFMLGGLMLAACVAPDEQDDREPASARTFGGDDADVLARIVWWGPYPDVPTCQSAAFAVDENGGDGNGIAACRLNGSGGAPAAPAGWYFREVKLIPQDP